MPYLTIKESADQIASNSKLKCGTYLLFFLKKKSFGSISMKTFQRQSQPTWKILSQSLCVGFDIKKIVGVGSVRNHN